MILRSTPYLQNEKFKQNNLTYKNVSCSETFKIFENYYEWAEKQVGFDKIGWCLDKDLLIVGNKIYAEDYCVFIPEEINNFLTESTKVRGQYPIGVTFDKSRGKYKACVCIGGGRRKAWGGFSDIEEASKFYINGKEEYAKQLAEEWRGQISVDAYTALMNYRTSPNGRVS